MKICSTCGAQIDDQARFCTMCGSADLVEMAPPVQQTQQYDQGQVTHQHYAPAYQQQNIESTSEDSGNGNILAGAVGAFLFALIGGLLYFVVYQIGFIAGICGLVTFVLANFGYGLFAKTKNKSSKVGLVISIVMMLLIIFLAEYFCVSFEIFNVYKSEGINIFDAIRATPEFLAESEISSAFAQDLVFAYIFGIVASISDIAKIAKGKNKK